MRGRITQVIRSPHCPEGRMYMVNERMLLYRPPKEDDPRIGICIVVWDDDDVVEEARKMIGQYVEVGE